MHINKPSGNMYLDCATCNPIGGECLHDCIYCLPSSTQILMSDFTTMSIENVVEGDSIIGLIESRGFNKFGVAVVTATSKRKSKTIILKTEDNQIECTPEHPLMGSTEVRNCSDWRLAKNYSPYNHLRYIGVPKEDNKERKLGWLRGFCDGDGCFFKQGFEAICTDEPLTNRFIKVCNSFGIEIKRGWKTSSEKSFNGKKKHPMLFTRAIQNMEKLKRLINFPKNPSTEFMKGYIAGMLDSDGSVSGNIRISQSKIVNKEKYSRIISCCKGLGLGFREEEKGIRILSSFRTRLFILFECKPSHSKKSMNLIKGFSVKGSKHSKIISSTIGNVKEVFNLQTSCGNFVANGYIVHNCYMKELKEKYPGVRKKYSGEPRLIEKELRGKINNPNNYTLFVQNCSDLFAKNVPKEIIERVLEYCRKFPENTYLFQTKNPARFVEFSRYFPKNTILCTTIETNRNTERFSKAPQPLERLYGISKMKGKFKIMITIEPIIDFDICYLRTMMQGLKPDVICIGADSKHSNLPEPNWNKVQKLIIELEKLTEVRKKSNLNRLLMEKR